MKSSLKFISVVLFCSALFASCGQNEISSSSPSLITTATNTTSNNTTTPVTSVPSTTPTTAPTTSLTTSGQTITSNPDAVKETKIFLLQEDGYCYLDKYDDKNCFVIEGTYSGDVFSAADISLGDPENGFENISCHNVELLNSRFWMYFDIETYFSSLNSNDSKINFFPHLYVRNQGWDGGNGTLINGNYLHGISSIDNGGIETLRLQRLFDSYRMPFITLERQVTITLSNEDDFAAIQMENNNVYYVLKGSYLEDVSVVRDSLIICDNDKGIELTAEKVLLTKTQNKTEFTAKFNLGPLKDKADIVVQSRLKYNGMNFDYIYGDVSNGQPVKISSVIVDDLIYEIKNINTNHIAGIHIGRVQTGETANIKFNDIIPGGTASDYEADFPVTFGLQGTNKVILKIRGFYSEDINLIKEDLTIVDFISGEKVTVPCTDLSLTNYSRVNGTKFTATFDITNVKVNPQDNNRFHVHVYYQDTPFDGKDGIFCPGVYKDKQLTSDERQVKIDKTEELEWVYRSYVRASDNSLYFQLAGA